MEEADHVLNLRNMKCETSISRIELSPGTFLQRSALLPPAFLTYLVRI